MKINLSIKLLCLLITLYSLNFNAQSYIGNTIDNYAGIQSLAYNPSNVFDSRFKADINLLSVSAFGGSDYFSISVSDIINSDEGFDFETDAEKFPTDANHFFVNADILGPSFMFNITPKSSVGLITRVRTLMNVNNINGELFETISEDFDSDDDFSFSQENLSGTIHAWAELGLVYGREILSTEKHFLKAGATLKYLQGAGSMFINSPNLTGNYDATNETLTTTGQLIYGASEDFDNDDINFNNLTQGFGVDIGFTYEFRPETSDSLTRKHNKYKFKIGASITDIGSVNYKDASVTTYNMNGTVDASSYEDEDDIEAFLEDNYTGSESIMNQKIKLPTAFHLLVDYHLAGKLYLSFQGNMSLVKDNTMYANSIINSATLSPRLETKWFSLYSPISMRQYGDFAWGAGLRVGPLMLGSGSIITNLISDATKTTDIYLGLKIPLYQ
ncbi:hypothetical protein PK35_00955 [Tamlana nanhaiensis]|uniref:DUF5723 domain-containing protein n=1 Tax=Neotamlana nanhaiensis TaxID=1382798 RepID=A0A0D7W9D0_9FLAO|nr:DUF5723 family protein [Tamlana nanhaiensis]KJD34402.1 hypothetical protein PK35_00955 [Tamlana nanhaiensis]